MNRTGSLFWLTLAMATGFAMFMIKYAVQNLEDNLVRVRKQTVAEQLEIRVLNAEWSYLTQPERLSELNRRFLSLAPISARQLEQSIAAIPYRPAEPPPTPPAPAVVEAAPAGPHLAGSNLPVTPTALEHAGAAPAPSAQALDQLFAQVAGGR